MNSLFDKKKTKSTVRSTSRLIPTSCDYCNKKAEFILVVSNSFTGKTTIKCLCKDCMLKWDADKLEL